MSMVLRATWMPPMPMIPRPVVVKLTACGGRSLRGIPSSIRKVVCSELKEQHFVDIAQMQRKNERDWRSR